MTRTRLSLLGAALLPLLSCSRDATGPDAQRVQLSVFAGDLQFGLVGAEVADPLEVIAIDAGSGEPAEGVTVQWSVSAGGGTVLPTSSITNERGVASTRLRLGSQLGDYQVQASADRQVGSATSFAAQAVARPEIQAITPNAAAAGQTVVITGLNFHPQPEYDAVRFDGIRGRILSVTTTRIEVVVPSCIPTRNVAVDVLVGAVASTTVAFSASGTPGTPLTLQPGQAHFITDPTEFSCLRLPGGIVNARYLLVAQNAAAVYGNDMPFELASYPGAVPLAVAPAAPRSAESTAEQFESRLRGREREWVSAAAALRARVSTLAAQQAEPAVGDRRTFRVLKTEDESVTITAEVKAVSQRAILYQDVTAPASGFTAADFTHFGNLFDDPIYDTDAQVFGTPSDIDGNGRVIILFTPRVNGLTARGDASFVAGYFYGCDLVEKTRCSDSNRGEIFYSLVPDPQAQFGDARTTTAVFKAVLPVLAHEFQHMINFALRNQSLDDLWLSEGLAHTAEDVVGDVFAARGDPITARDFQHNNYARASRFLSMLPNVSLVDEASPGTLELRGGAWLFLRYLRAHYGGNQLLSKLTHTQLSGAQNVSAQTGQVWSKLLSDFTVALYHSALSTPATPLDELHTFGSLPVRPGMIAEIGAFPLYVGSLGYADGALASTLPSAGTSLYLLLAPGNTSYAPINLVFTGALGGPFNAQGNPQLTIYRAR